MPSVSQYKWHTINHRHTYTHNVHICLFLYTYIFIHVHTCIYINIYIHVHTHTHETCALVCNACALDETNKQLQKPHLKLTSDLMI